MLDKKVHEADNVLTSDDDSSKDLIEKILNQSKLDKTESLEQIEVINDNNNNNNLGDNNNNNNLGGNNNNNILGGNNDECTYIIFDNNVYILVDAEYINIVNDDINTHYCRLLENLNKIINNKLAEKQTLEETIIEELNVQYISDFNGNTIKQFTVLDFLNMDIIDNTPVEDVTDIRHVENVTNTNSENVSTKLISRLKNGLKNVLTKATNLKSKKPQKEEMECKDMYEIIISNGKITFNKKQIFFKKGTTVDVNNKNTYNVLFSQKMYLEAEIFGMLCSLTVFIENKTLEKIENSPELQTQLIIFNTNKKNLIYYYETLIYYSDERFFKMNKQNFIDDNEKRREKFRYAQLYATTSFCSGVALGGMLLSLSPHAGGLLIGICITTYVPFMLGSLIVGCGLDFIEKMQLKMNDLENAKRELQYKKNLENDKINTENLNKLNIDIGKITGGKHKTHKKSKNKKHKNKKPKNTKRKHTKKYEN